MNEKDDQNAPAWLDYQSPPPPPPLEVQAARLGPLIVAGFGLSMTIGVAAVLLSGSLGIHLLISLPGALLLLVCLASSLTQSPKWRPVAIGIALGTALMIFATVASGCLLILDGGFWLD